MTDKPVREHDKFMLRMPEGMREAVAERAKRNGRSMNSEIVQIINTAITNSAFEEFTSKENLEKLPDPIKREMIIRRTLIARVQMAEALRDIEENLELLQINGDEIMSDMTEAWWKNHDAKTVKAINEKWSSRKKPK